MLQGTFIADVLRSDKTQFRAVEINVAVGVFTELPALGRRGDITEHSTISTGSYRHEEYHLEALYWVMSTKSMYDLICSRGEDGGSTKTSQRDGFLKQETECLCLSSAFV